MNYTPEWIAYESTGSFSKLAVNYLQQHNSIQTFYNHAPSLEGIKNAIEDRETFDTRREVLVTALQQQYSQVKCSNKVSENISKLAFPNSFTVCTAHQPNIFTGYLYFIYKVVHTIKLAETLAALYPDKHFVPVYYMGSEDNDLEELNHIFINNEKITWSTTQTGPVGRMNTKGLDVLINQLNGQLSIFQHGAELINLLKEAYLKSDNIQQATLKLVNELFSDYGLVVLIPDQPAFKKLMIPVFEDDLFNNSAATIVKQTAERLSRDYHAQVNPRDINLFYMQPGIRERIILEGDRFIVNNTDISFSEEELREKLHTAPELFSPNVVLRGIMQETILPNVAFVGGGSELAYWLELKALFNHYRVPYPVLLLRNSFMLVNSDMKLLMNKLNLGIADLFKSENTLLNELVLKKSEHQLSLQKERDQLAALYQQLETASASVDPSLVNHVKALFLKADKNIESLEKKMIRAEKRKYEAQAQQLQRLKNGLFPGNNLQERVENFLPFYAIYGRDFISLLHQASPAITDQFGVLIEQSV